MYYYYNGGPENATKRGRSRPGGDLTTGVLPAVRPLPLSTVVNADNGKIVGGGGNRGFCPPSDANPFSLPSIDNGMKLACICFANKELACICLANKKLATICISTQKNELATILQASYFFDLAAKKYSLHIKFSPQNPNKT